MRRRTWLALAGAVAALPAPAAARADIFAAVQVAAPAPRTDFDIAVLNASTGARVPLPAGTNTTADETHPSITIDGRRLAFERSDPAAGTVRIIAADLTTSQSADLFNGFEVAQRAPSDPAILPSSSVVYTGGPFVPVSGGFSSPVVSTALSNFPTGPFPRSTVEQQYTFAANGSLQDLAAGGALIAFQETRAGFQGELVLRQLGGIASFPLATSKMTFANPNMAASNPEIVVFDQRSVSGGVGTGDIAFRPATTSTFVGTPTVLPAIVNSPADESQPALTAEGRYLAFVRHGADGHDRLLIWDSQTQTLLNAQGVDLGAMTSHDVGSVSLYSKLILAVPSFNPSGLITVQLTAPSGIGIIVQRILGTRRVLGRQGYKLGPARRVPLGTFKKGRHGIRWDLQVNGRKLAPGRYLVTVRAVTPKVVVRELGRPRVIRVR
jgi:WD40 repeat protein